jgi:hypothetical protein
MYSYSQIKTYLSIENGVSRRQPGADNQNRICSEKKKNAFTTIPPSTNTAVLRIQIRHVGRVRNFSLLTRDRL